MEIAGPALSLQTSGSFEVGRAPRKKAGSGDVPTQLAAEFGKRLRDARIAADLSQRALGEIVGIAHAEISKIETGVKTNLETSTIERLAAALHLDVALLITPRKVSRKK